MFDGYSLLFFSFRVVRNCLFILSVEEVYIGKYCLIKIIGKGNFVKVKFVKYVLIGKEVNKLFFFIYSCKFGCGFFCLIGFFICLL